MISLDDYEILLVEDDPADAELTVLSLRKERLANNIEIARDGAEALDFIFCRGAYAERSFERPPHLVECYRLGVNSYIEKPVELRKFREVVCQFGVSWLMVNQPPPAAAFSASFRRTP